MRILLVSFLFPPYNIIGAVRVGKTAKYLVRTGHDVRVIAAADAFADHALDKTLQVEIPADSIVYTPWTDVDVPYRALLAAARRLRRGRSGSARRELHVAREKTVTGTRPATTSDRAPSSMGTRIRALYTDLVHQPDWAIGWRRPAGRAGLDLVARWRPDVILASGSPWTAFLVARDLSRRTGIPWVADLRDLWAANHTTPVSDWRKRTLDRWTEARVLRSAASLVTVSEPLADRLRSDYPELRVDVILNGYDAEDYARAASRPRAAPAEAAAPGPLRVVYTGQVNREMLPLLDALRLLGHDARDVRLEIVGNVNPVVFEKYTALAEARGVAECLTWLPPVPHAEAARVQQEADLLVLFIHDTPEDRGVYTGKLLEYVGAGRPILVVGSREGVAAALVLERGLGAAEATPEAIAQRLREWLGEKRACGRIAPPRRPLVDDLSREAQTRAFAEVLRRATAGA